MVSKYFEYLQNRMEEALRKMISRECKPDPNLSAYISSYWYYSIYPDAEKHFDILPDGYFDLVITKKENRIEDIRLTGIWTKTVSISYTENAEVFGVSFKPAAVDGLLDFNVSEILNDSRETACSDFNLVEKILDSHLGVSFELLVSYLNNRFLALLAKKQPDPRLKKCFELIDNSHGNLTVSEISNTIGLSARQLHKKVNNMIGIGVKDYSKIVRFKFSLQEAKKDQFSRLNYYDQSHHIREIKQYTGLTPKKIDLKNNDRFIQYYYFD